MVHIKALIIFRCHNTMTDSETQNSFSTEVLQEIVQRVRTAIAPEKIVLFGSRARRDHRPHSDIDLLVIQKSELPRFKRPIPIYAALAELTLPMDAEIMVYTPQEVEEWSGSPAAFVTTALREGIVLYEKHI